MRSGSVRCSMRCSMRCESMHWASMHGAPGELFRSIARLASLFSVSLAVDGRFCADRPDSARACGGGCFYAARVFCSFHATP